MKFFQGRTYLIKIFEITNFQLNIYISTIQKFRGVTSLRFSPVPPSLHIKSKLVCMCIWYITFTSNNYVVLCISTFISYFLFLLYLISTDLTSIYCRSRTTTLQTPINVLYWKRFSNSFYKRRMYLIHYIIYLIPISIRRFEDYRNNQLATLEVKNILM